MSGPSKTREKRQKWRDEQGDALLAPVGGEVIEVLPKRTSVLEQLAGYLPAIQAIDVNRDGEVSAEEMRAFLLEDADALDDELVLSDAQLSVIAMQLAEREAERVEAEEAPEPATPLEPAVEPVEEGPQPPE